MNNFSKFIFFMLIASLFFILPKVRSWNDASRMATVQSLVEKKSFVIDESIFVNTGDKVFINGHFYSDKPVFPSLMGAVIYLPLYMLGVKLHYGWSLAYYVITFFTVKIFWLMGLFAFYLALRYSNINKKHRLWLTLALGLASLHLTWSSTFNNHSMAASQVSIGFYFLLKSTESESVGRDLFLSGLFFSLAGVVDIPIAAFYVGFFVYIIMKSNLREKYFFYLVPLILTALPACYINYHISGSIIPLQVNKSYFEYPGSPWLEYHGLSGVEANKNVFLFNYSLACLFGPNGFIIYNPLLFISIPFLIREIREKKKFRYEAIAISLASLVIVAYYLIFTKNFGGNSYSVRWFIPLLPMLFFFMYPMFKNFNVERKRLFLALFCFSIAISCIGLINPWSDPQLSRIPLVSNIKKLILYIN